MHNLSFDDFLIIKLTSFIREKSYAYLIIMYLMFLFFISSIFTIFYSNYVFWHMCFVTFFSPKMVFKILSLNIVHCKLLHLNLQSYVRAFITLSARFIPWKTHFCEREKSPRVESQHFIFLRGEHQVRSSLNRRLRDIHVTSDSPRVAARRLTECGRIDVSITSLSLSSD